MDNRRYVLRSRPVHLAGPENFELERGPIPEPQDGQALIPTRSEALDTVFIANEEAG